MAVQNIIAYNYKDTFSLDIIDFEKACLVNEQKKENEYSIFWIKEGRGTYHIDFNKFSFEDNVLFFLSPGQVFTVDSEKIKTAYRLSFHKDFYCIQTHDKEISCNGVLFNNIYETPFIEINKKNSSKLQLIISDMIDEFSQDHTAQYDMLQSYLKQFIINSVRFQNNKNEIKDTEGTRLFKDFSTLVDMNFKSVHAVSDYALRLGVSPKSLSKHFKKIKKQKPSDFIKNRILLEAKRNLIYTNNSVKEIAFDLGFNDPAYFTRFFTKATSQSPLQFKKEFHS